MADEAYRAVFLRVHPTGKMVLSLTTEADGNEGALRRSSSPTSSASRRSTSRSCPADDEPLRQRATASTPARPAARRRRSPSATEKIRAKAQLLAGAALDAAAGRAARGTTARSSATARATPDDRRLALYAHGTGALPPGRRGRPRRADRLPRLSRVDLDLDLVGDLECAEQDRELLDAEVRLLDRRVRRMTCRRRRPRGRRPPGASLPTERRGRPRRARRRRRPGSTRVERKAMSCLRRTSSSIVSWMFAMSSSPSACIPPVALLDAQRAPRSRRARRGRPASAPTSIVAAQSVTWSRRSWPALAAAPVRPVRTDSVPFSGAELVGPASRAR